VAAPSKDGAEGSDTIHALSSGRPPAAIAIVRLSGDGARRILVDLAGLCPEPKRASLRTLRDSDGDTLDHAFVLWCPGPRSATGEDLVEFHLHGGRAVVDAVLGALTRAGSRPALPGEFTRRALLNGRLDLEGVEGLSDLLSAETEYQRREALRRADGALGRRLAHWNADLLAIAAQHEAAIDYDGDIEPDEMHMRADLLRLQGEIDGALSRISAERLRDGLRVAIVGPVNAGKSSLFNALVGSDAAIVSPVAGTTRDLVERPISLAGMPLVLIDTAGDRDAIDEIERIGVDRARAARATADIVIDLEAGNDLPHRIAVSAKSDLLMPVGDAIAVSALTGEGVAALLDALAEKARALLPGEGEVALNRRYREGLAEVLLELGEAAAAIDIILAAEHIRRARDALDRLTGSAGFEDMLDTLFSRFCLGK
jgi:tRNA modification GTPase